MTSPRPTPAASIAELTRLRSQLEDLLAAFTAIRGGGVDAIMVGDPNDERLYTLTSADRPYRVIVEEMGEGAATVSERGVLLYVNRRLSDLIGRDRRDLPWVLVGEVGLAAGTGKAGLPPVTVTSTTTAIRGSSWSPGGWPGVVPGRRLVAFYGQGHHRCSRYIRRRSQDKVVKVVITCRRRSPLSVRGPGRSAGASSGQARAAATGHRAGQVRRLA